MAVANIIADLKLDVPSIVGGILHDTVEDTLTSLDEIKGQFGREIASLVDGVTKLGRANFSSREEKQAENFRKMMLAMGKDVRVILIKLADRVHNMRTLEHMPPEKQYPHCPRNLGYLRAIVASSGHCLDQERAGRPRAQASQSGDLLSAQAQRREEKERPGKIYRAK